MRRERVSAALLAVLLLLVPFEPRQPLLRGLGLNFTLLEVAAAVVVVALLALHRERLAARPPAPLLALAALAVAYVVSAAVAPQHRAAAAVFSLRLLAALLFALAVFALPPRVQERGLGALAAGGAAAAVLAVAEALGARGIDPLLDLFRERAFSLGDARRATAGAAGPNIGAAFIAAGLLAGVARLAGRSNGAARSAGLAAILGAGLLATCSRGGLAACLAGLVALGWMHAARSPGRRAATAALAALLAMAGLSLAWPPFRTRLASEWPQRPLSARCELVEAPARFPPGEVRRVRVRVTNDGAGDWPADHSFRLSVGWYDPAVGRAEGWTAFPFGRGLPAGGSVLVDADLRAPERAGPYVLVLDVNSAATGYFSTAGTTPGWLPVAVGANVQAPSPPPPPPARRGRFELWRIALVMWRAHPLTGVGPDNFRRVHDDYGEWIARGNIPVGAHNVFLEAAANTGLLGLLALLAVFGSAFAAAVRARGRPDDQVRAGAVLALLAAMVVQGLVDSLLAFTGVYLLFALVVGLAATLSDRARSAGGPA